MYRSGKSPRIRNGTRRARIGAASFVALVLSLQAAAAMAAGGKPQGTLVNIADTRGIAPGMTRWIADLYNASYFQFALLVVGTMVGMGLVLGFCSDRLMGLLGINLGKMQHHE
jgi:hypothetical protein